MCFIAVLLASTLAVVAPVTMRTSISAHLAAHGPVEPVCFRHRGAFHEVSKRVLGRTRVPEGTDVQQRAELFLDLPGGLDEYLKL
jgi:hypothetical protein